jgi:hypothetical protein
MKTGRSLFTIFLSEFLGPQFLNARTQSWHLLQFTILVLAEQLNLTLNNLLWRFLSTLRRYFSGLCY